LPVGRLSILRHLLPAAALSCCFTGAQAQVSFPLHTSGQFIVDSAGKRVHLNAVNWYGAESSDFVVAGLQSATLPAIVQQIKSLGFNAVRLPWSNQLYESNPPVGSYALAANPGLQGENALAILDQVVNALTGAGIMVILDNHNSNAEWCCGNDGNALWYNSQYPEASWLADWQGMAGRYLGNPLVIGADLRNEPRITATWGGDAGTDWHGAAQRGGNAVLAVNPRLLVFVEGVNYALDLSGAAALPVSLNVPNQLVYEAHDYGFDYSNLVSYNDYVNRITPLWGYLVTGRNPAPLWLGEFGTCNTAQTCVQSGNPSDNGYWFGFATAYLGTYDLDWSYWAINGTQSTGAGRTWGARESYGVLNPSWNGVALPALSQALSGIAAASGPGLTLVPGGNISIAAPGLTGASTVTVAPRNGFTGTVSLSCALTAAPANAVAAPTCSVPASTSVSSGAVAAVTVSIATTGTGSASTHGVPGAPGAPARAALGVALAGLLLLPVLARRRSVLLLLVVFCALCGCGSTHGGGSSTATTAGSYTFTVTGNAAGLAPASVQIAVNLL
jgi:endoglucanase